MTSSWCGRRSRHRNVAGRLDQACVLGRIEAVCGSTCADLCGSAARPQVTSLPPCLPELDSESHHSFREALQGENVLVPPDVSSHLDSDRSHQTASQNSRNQSWSMPPDALSREIQENVQNVRALESVHPANHPNVQRQLSDELTPERQLSNQTRECTIERADEPPTQRPRLENPASSIRFVQELMIQDIGFPPRLWKMNMWTEMDSEVSWQQQVDDHIRENNGKPACLCQEEWDELCSSTCENVTLHVCFCRSEFTGMTATRMTRGDEFPRHMTPESEWPRFLQAMVTEWAAILDTSAVTIISPAAAKDIRKHLSHRIVLSVRRCWSSVKSQVSVVCSWSS